MLVYGRNVAEQYLKKNEKVRKIYLQVGFHDEKIDLLLGKCKIQPKFMQKIELDRLANENHQGIIIDAGDYRYADLDDIVSSDNGFVVILDHITDPHNFGAIIRTCVAAGVDGIIIPKDRSVSVNSTVMKTSVGMALNIKICMVTNINHAIRYLKDKNYWIYAADMSHTKYTDVSYSGNVALIIGNEGKGVSDLVIKSSDYVVSIPLAENVDSLNASVAAGILIYEVVRQRN